MAQTAMTIRMDNDLKVKFNNLCEELGMSTNTAFNIFARQAVRKRSIPFEIKVDSDDEIRAKAISAFAQMRSDAAASGVQDLSLDQINEIIKEVRNGR